jgi:hypothetical protein
VTPLSKYLCRTYCNRAGSLANARLTSWCNKINGLRADAAATISRPGIPATSPFEVVIHPYTSSLCCFEGTPVRNRRQGFREPSPGGTQRFYAGSGYLLGASQYLLRAPLYAGRHFSFMAAGKTLKSPLLSFPNQRLSSSESPPKITHFPMPAGAVPKPRPASADR